MFVKVAWEVEVMENPGVDGGITLEWILKKKHGMHRMFLFQKRGQWRAVSVTGTHIRILKEARNFLTSWAGLSVSKREALHVESVTKYLAQNEVQSICGKKKTDILYDSLINQFQTQLSKY